MDKEIKKELEELIYYYLKNYKWGYSSNNKLTSLSVRPWLMHTGAYICPAIHFTLQFPLDENDNYGEEFNMPINPIKYEEKINWIMAFLRIENEKLIKYFEQTHSTYAILLTKKT